MAVCNKSGMLAIYNESNNIFLSPDADGPIKFMKPLDSKEKDTKQINKNEKDNFNLKIKNISKFGRDFSIVQVPYCFKLLMQELQIMNVQFRIITEDNIDNIEKLAYSKKITNIANVTNTIVPE